MILLRNLTISLQVLLIMTILTLYSTSTLSVNLFFQCIFSLQHNLKQKVICRPLRTPLLSILQKLKACMFACLFVFSFNTHHKYLTSKTSIFSGRPKHDKVLPIHKLDKKNYVNNCRLVAIPHTFSKLFEKEIAVRLWNFLEKIIYCLNVTMVLGLTTQQKLQ